jgi:hypothetical protein
MTKHHRKESTEPRESSRAKTDGTNQEGNLVRVLLGETETGWAETLGEENLAQIRSIPVEGECNILDLVRLDAARDADTGLPRIKEVRHSTYPCKSLVLVHNHAQFFKLHAILSFLGATCENFWSAPQKLVQVL